MPDISNDGKILFSLYEDGKYKISLLENISKIDEKNVGYGKEYFLNNSNFSGPITQLDTTKSSPYKDQFPNMFLMPKIMGDYGTIKPGFYFYSTEIINRLSLFGGASINQLKDVGADIVRVSCPDQESTIALKKIVSQVKIPIVADIH